MPAPRFALLVVLAAIGCTHTSAAEGDVAPPPSGAALALQCARATAQSGGFLVRPADPREPYLLLADLGGIGPRNDRPLVRVLPGSSPEQAARVMANAEGPGRGPASNEATEVARRIESRCGRVDGAR